ncbi:hypothetical protein PVAND_013240 [Polypedilum vanderplanki]|uniref:Mpv17-like protein n=1 Tax=Polypedilum vanderplanki TaxID=319348 RepID=A0A9J6CNX5_POLVA|nr:hypothetical protein PVAND_013240 [Polypedilum vanderplanki]
MFGRNNSEPLWKIFRKHPITRGMASYLVIWPTANIIQQTLCEKDFDWWKVVRFGLYGCFITAPSLYCWVKLATFMYPNNQLRLCMAKALIEQISYTPLAMCTFFYSMTWLETFSAAEAFQEVKVKFPPTYFTAITIWPLIGTINFAFVPERNRVLFTSCFSLLWTIYLAHMKNRQRDKMLLDKNNKSNELTTNTKDK